MLARRERHRHLLIPAVVVLGLGVLGWKYLGKDLVRHIRINTM
jgi:hypothetical protein